MSEQRIQIEWRPGQTVSAIFHPVIAPVSRVGVVLAHGAGGNLLTPSLGALCESLAARGFPALRFNFPYKENRRSAPDANATLEECYRAVAARARELFAPAALVLGGRSMGGRIASQIAAASPPEGLRGLVFLAYPLHPPGKPDKLRDRHLGSIRVPALFLSGTRDAFAGKQLLTASLQPLKTVAKVHWLEGADHSFRTAGRKPAEVDAEVLDCVSSFLSLL